MTSSNRRASQLLGVKRSCARPGAQTMTFRSRPTSECTPYFAAPTSAMMTSDRWPTGGASVGPCPRVLRGRPVASEDGGNVARLRLRRRGCAESRLELRLVLVRERGLQDLAARALELLQHLVRRDLPDQDEERRALGRQAGGELAHEPIVDAHVREGARHRPGRRSHGHTQEGIQEDQAHEGAPEPSTRRAVRREVDRLVQLDLALLVLHGHDGVLEVDEVVLLHPSELQTDLLGLVRIVVLDHHERVHRVSPLGVWVRLVLRTRHQVQWSGSSQGTSRVLTIMTTIEKGTPTRMKSPNA